MRFRPLFPAALVTVLIPCALAQVDFIEPATLDSAELVKFWQFQVPLEPNQALVAAYLVDDALYLATNDGYAIALDAFTGAIRWLQPVTGTAYRVRRPAHAGDKVIFVTPVDIQVYDRRSGDGLARRELRFPAGTGAVSDGRRIYFGGLDARLHCHDVETLMRDWRVGVEGPVSSTPVLFGPAVFCASQGREVIAATQQRAFRWHNVVGGAVSADLVAFDNRVYVACEDQSLYCFDVISGTRDWRTLFSSPLREPPLPTEKLVFQYAEGEGLVAIERGLMHEIEKRVRWALPQARHALAVNGNTLYALDAAGDLLVVDTTSGSVQHTIPTNGLNFVMPTGVEPTIYLAAADGRTVCLRPKGKPLLRADDVRAALAAKPQADKNAAAEPAKPAATTQPAAEPNKAAQAPPVGGKSKISKGYRGNGQ